MNAVIILIVVVHRRNITSETYKMMARRSKRRQLVSAIAMQAPLAGKLEEEFLPLMAVNKLSRIMIPPKQLVLPDSHLKKRKSSSRRYLHVVVTFVLAVKNFRTLSLFPFAPVFYSRSYKKSQYNF
jgi:hypothetical protein